MTNTDRLFTALKHLGITTEPTETMDNLTTTQYRVDAVPFETLDAANKAILEFKPSDPESTYTVRQYNEGFYVLIQFPAGGIRWLTKRERSLRRPSRHTRK